MSKILVISALTLFGMVGWANQGIYGTWKLPTISQGDFAFNISFTFEKDKVTAKNVCTFMGHTDVTESSVPAKIDTRSVTTLSSAHAQNGMCSVDVVQGTMEYSVSADDKTLTLQPPGQNPAVLTRE